MAEVFGWEHRSPGSAADQSSLNLAEELPDRSKVDLPAEKKFLRNLLELGCNRRAFVLSDLVAAAGTTCDLTTNTAPPGKTNPPVKPLCPLLGCVNELLDFGARFHLLYFLEIKNRFAVWERNSWEGGCFFSTSRGWRRGRQWERNWSWMLGKNSVDNESRSHSSGPIKSILTKSRRRCVFQLLDRSERQTIPTERLTEKGGGFVSRHRLPSLRCRGWLG